MRSSQQLLSRAWSSGMVCHVCSLLPNVSEEPPACTFQIEDWLWRSRKLFLPKRPHPLPKLFNSTTQNIIILILTNIFFAFSIRNSRRVPKAAKSDYWIIISVLCACPHRKTRLLLSGLSRNFTLGGGLSLILSRKSQFFYDRTKIIGALHENLRTFMNTYVANVTMVAVDSKR